MTGVLLITGGGRGIGAAAARLAAAEGYRVAVNYRARQDAAEALVDEIAAAGGAAAAVSVMPGVVFSGSNDGGFRAYSTSDGSIIWTYDTNREFETVNGIPGRGGSLLGPGAAIAGGMVFVNSGYGSHGGRRGNVLLAFGLQ